MVPTRVKNKIGQDGCGLCLQKGGRFVRTSWCVSCNVSTAVLWSPKLASRSHSCLNMGVLRNALFMDNLSPGLFLLFLVEPLAGFTLACHECLLVQDEGKLNTL